MHKVRPSFQSPALCYSDFLATHLYMYGAKDGDDPGYRAWLLFLNAPIVSEGVTWYVG